LAWAAYFFLGSAPIPAARPSPPPETQAPEAAGPSPIDVGPLDKSDALVASLAASLSSDPRFQAWFRAKDLARRFVAAVIQVAAGESPRSPLAFLAPAQPFTVAQTPARMVIDSKSYTRYDGIVAILGSLDASACAAAFKKIEPLLDTAYAEAGHPDARFSLALGRALRTLLETPLPNGDVAVRRGRKPVVFEFVDPKLEALSPAQKHLLRLGPDNARKLLAKLRELGQALDLTLL
jgi:hypothetical protein